MSNHIGTCSFAGAGLGRLPGQDQDLEDATDELIRNLTTHHCSLVGDFTLSSGKKSDWYLDIRRALLVSGSLNDLIGAMLGRTIAGMLDCPDYRCFQYLGSIGYGGALLGGAVRPHIWLPCLVARTDQKQHGLGGLIGGPHPSIATQGVGGPILLVDDVLTSGKNLISAKEIFEKAGYRVVGGLVVCDRQEGGREACQAAGFGVESLLRRADFHEAASAAG